MISSFVGVLFDGFAYGMLLFLLSVGLSVTLGMMNFVNLAHCSFAMLGGFVTVTLTNDLGWPFLASLPLAFLSAALVSIALERVLYRRLYGAWSRHRCRARVGDYVCARVRACGSRRRARYRDRGARSRLCVHVPHLRPHCRGCRRARLDRRFVRGGEPPWNQ